MRNLFRKITTFVLVIFILLGPRLLHAQQIVDYIVLKNGDTIHNNIKKMNFETNILRMYDYTEEEDVPPHDYSLDTIASFFYKNVKWQLAEKWENSEINAQRSYDPILSIQFFNNLFGKRKNNNDSNVNYIFLPDTKTSKKYNLGVWGKLFGTKTEFHVNVIANAKTVLYEYSYLFNTGNTMGVNSTLYIKNDSLGICHLYFANKKSNPELKKLLKDILTAYTYDKPNLLARLDEKFKYDYKSIYKYLKEYIKN